MATSSKGSLFHPKLLPVLVAGMILCLSSSSPGQDALRDLNGSIERLSETVIPSLVQIESSGYAPAANENGVPAVAIQSSTGSGVIISNDGLIVTNAHVVEGARRVRVQLARSGQPPGQSILRPRGRRIQAEVVGIDLETDLALLRAEETNLPALELADSETIRQGQIVLAYGSPFGLENSVSMGIVSSEARQLEPEDPMIYIQTDAPINPGNSGGPLVDVEGRVVGINTMIFSASGASSGLGFAVPSNIVRSVVEQLRQNGVFTRGEIAVGPQTITPELAAGLGLDRDYGVLLADVVPGGAADIAGVRIGDIVLTLDGKPMENARQFLVNLYGQVPDGSVRLRLLRDGVEIDRVVAVRAPRREPERMVRMVDRRQRLVPRLGILAVPVDADVESLLPVLRLPGGILVTNLALAAGAPRGLFLPGDVIYSANGQAVATTEELEAVLAEYDANASVVFQIERRGRLSFIVADLY